MKRQKLVRNDRPGTGLEIYDLVPSKPGRKAGPRRKPKAGLTPREKAIVEKLAREAQARWDHLFSLNVFGSFEVDEQRRPYKV